MKYDDPFFLEKKQKNYGRVAQQVYINLVPQFIINLNFGYCCCVPYILILSNIIN